VAEQGLLRAIGVGSQVAQQSEPDFGLRVGGRNDVEDEIDNLLAHHCPFGPGARNRARIRNWAGPPAVAGLMALPKPDIRLQPVLLPAGLLWVRKASAHHGP
jgi:hypothetical protein